MSKQKIELVVATATKIHQNDSLIVVIDPQFADYAEPIQEELGRITGHHNHTVLPVPQGAVKFYRVERDITVAVNGEMIPANLNLPDEDDDKKIYLSEWKIEDKYEPGTTGFRVYGRTKHGKLVDFLIEDMDLNEARRAGEYNIGDTTYIFGEKR